MTKLTRWWLAATAALAIACGHAPSPTPPPSANQVAPAMPPAPAADATKSTEPRHDLSVDEHAGGHTLARHVGRTDAQLRERLDNEPGISAASTYTDRQTAERVVAQALDDGARRIDAWTARGRARPNLTLNVHVPDAPIGRSLSRRGRAVEPCHDALVVLRARGDGFYVLTSYPEFRR